MNRPGWFSLTTNETRIDSGQPNVWAILETVIAAYLMLYTIYKFQNLSYIYFAPIVAPLFFLRSSASTNLGIQWFAQGIHGSLERRLGSFGLEKIDFATAIGFIVYIVFSSLFIYIFPALYECFFQNPFNFTAGLALGALQFVFASGTAVATSILIAGLGQGGNDPAGAIEVAVNGTQKSASYVFYITWIVSQIYIYSQFLHECFYGFAIGAATVSALGALAGKGVVRTISTIASTAGPGYTSGAVAIKNAASELGSDTASWKAVGGGFFYFPGMAIGFFLSSFIIRLLSSLYFFGRGFFEIPKNISRLCFCTSPLQVPELIPGIPSDHDARVVNVLGVGIGAIRLKSTETILFGLVWCSMLPFWVIGGIIYRLYMKSTILFTWPLLFSFGNEIRTSGSEGLKHDYRSVLIKISLIYAIANVIGTVILPLLPSVLENFRSEKPLLTIVVVFSRLFTQETGYLPISWTIVAIFSVFGAIFADKIIQDDSVPSRREWVKTQLYIYQVVMNILRIINYSNYSLVALYILLIYLNRSNLIDINGEWFHSILRLIYGKFEQSLY